MSFWSTAKRKSPSILGGLAGISSGLGMVLPQYNAELQGISLLLGVLSGATHKTTEVVPTPEQDQNNN